MKLKFLSIGFVFSLLFLLVITNLYAQPVYMENSNFRLSVDKKTGAVSSFLIKKNKSELIGEDKLQANFRICLPLKDYITNYIDGMEQKPKSVTTDGKKITVVFSGMKSAKGTYPLDLTYWITMYEDYVSFKASLTNHDDENPVSEFWFPRIGGMTGFGNHRDAKLAIPSQIVDSRHDIGLFSNYPGGRGLGAEAAEWSVDYPGMCMPWWDIYDAKSNLGIYMGYHDPTFRFSTWHTYLMPNATGDYDPWFTKEKAAGKPVGLVFSHVRYPFIKAGETFESGEFIVRVHEGDWHNGSQFYRKWFMTHFPFDKKDSWLRKENSWFTSIIYQPEDKIVTDFKGYTKWTRDAKEYGINTYEIIGWDNGGLERNYPLYIPEEKLGGHAGFKQMLQSIKTNGGRSLVFTNYNILDISTDWYKKELHKYMAQDEFGNQGLGMAWGEGTLLARHLLNTRFHVRSSVTPRIEEILEGYFLQLVKDGASGFQIDKLVVGAFLDFNPLNKLKPDVALCEGLVQAIDRLYKKCLAINPDFRMASEFGVDRLIPYFDVGYRNSSRYTISTMRYVFPEWTSCNHISAPRDFKSVNGAVLTGSVICVEPDSYQGSLKQPIYEDLANYIKEVGRIRTLLADDVFLSRYHDEQFAKIQEYDAPQTANSLPAAAVRVASPGEMPGTNVVPASSLKPASGMPYKVHENVKTGKQTLVVANDAAVTKQYVWEFTNVKSKGAILYSPFENPRKVKMGEVLTIKGDGLHILVAE